MKIEMVRLLNRYSELESRFTLMDGTQTYLNLVTASTNRQYPVQRWFHLKEAYSLDLLDTLIREWDIPWGSIQRVLDPFCGMGTSLLATQRLAKKLGRSDLMAVGLERNPFLHFVAQTKLQWYNFDQGQFETQFAYLLNGARKEAPDLLPELSTLHREDVLTRQKLKEILGYKSAIDSVETAERALLLLGYASVLEALSGTRKDGRMIRIVKNKERIETTTALRSAWSSMNEDIKIANQYYSPIETKVLLGDGRTFAVDGTDEKLSDFDVIIYSPPYLNNIDYTEVYKIELWLCNFVETLHDFRSLRHRTFRSHPSVRFLEPVAFLKIHELSDVHATMSDLTNALPHNEDQRWRTELFNGYFDDMYLSLKHQKEALRKGGWIFCVVGNSLHGSDTVPEDRVPVASDLIIASIADAIGLEVKGIQIARYLKRRGPDGHLLRESIVVMRKPYDKDCSDG